jgi:HK97 family phage prohead protease
MSDKKKLPEAGTTEIRSFSMPDLRAKDEDGNIVEGHAAVFGQEYDMGYYTEVIARGAFDKTDFTDVLFCINHDLKRIPLARSRNNNENSTLRLSVDIQGLSTRALLDTENNAEAKAFYSAVQRGDISGMSYIFRVRGEEWENLDSDMPKRTITDIAKVYEVGGVSFPANPGTDINARSQSALESAKRTLESARARAKLESSAGQDDLELEKLKAKSKLLF